MKDFQFIIQNFLKDHEKHKKYLALLLVLSIVVSFAVPFSLIMPAISMTGELICGMEEHIHSDECYELFCGLEESDEHLHNADCYTLVCDIPEHIHSQECYSDYEEENYEEDLSQFDLNNDYLINLVNETSISSISGNNTTDDVTLLVGANSDLRGNTVSETISKANSKYAIGIASQFSVFVEGNFEPTDSDSEGRTAIGGNFIASTNNQEYEIGNGDYTDQVSLDVLLNNTGFAHAIVNGNANGLIPTSWNEYTFYDNNGNEYKSYVVKRIWINNNSEYSASTNFTNNAGDRWSGNYSDYFYRGADIFNVSEQFSELRKRSEKLSKISATGTTTISGESTSGKTVTFDGTGISENAETVYFTMESWDEDIRHVCFTNVPANANLIVNCGGENVNIKQEQNYHKFSTSINGTIISKFGEDDNVVGENNDEKSEQILYNFYNATSLYIKAHFNGTILAPNADVTSSINAGSGNGAHLSGALIAKSFKGDLEFGYRPYQGTIDILGSSMGYTIPVDKVVTGATNQWLAGAKFDIIENYDTENAKIVNSFTSGEGTNFVDIPSKVDFTGGTDYRTSAKNLTGTYTIKEVSAPEGYIADTAKTYTVTITEEIQSNGLIETGSGTIPTYIKAKVEFSNGSSFNIELKDTYSYDGSSSKQIRRELTIGDETFYLEIDNGKVSEVSKNDGTPTGAGEVIVTDNKQIKIDVLVTEISSYLVTTQNENGEDVPATVTSMIDVFDNEKEGLTAYNINKIHLENANVSDGYILTFYYSDKSSATFEGNNSDNNSDLNLGSLNKENVIGISIKFNQNVSSNNFWIQESTNWQTIFGTDYNQSKTFEAGRIYYFPESATKQESTTVTYTETAIISSSSTSYYTTTSKSYYDKYAPIIAAPSTAQIYPTTPVDSKYYYNPDDIMMMPMPSANLTFENRCGLLFKKVDSNGNPLSGATIKLQHKNGENYADVTDTAVWNWTGSSFTIDPEKLELNKVYRFHEEKPPAGYETASEIYFKKTDTNKILWGYAENNLENNLDLTYDNNRTITMTDTKITGAKVKLKKVDSTDNTPLNGAKFKLYSADGEIGTLVYPLADAPNDSFEVSGTSGTGENAVVTGEIDLYQLLKEAGDNVNSTYVQNGYLKEGLYYLYEVSAPAGYKGGQKFYFTIKENSNGTYAVETGLPQYVSLNLSSEEGNKKWFTYDKNNNKMDDTCSGGITNVQSILIKASTQPTAWTKIGQLSFTSIGNGIYEKTFESPVNLSKFEVQNPNYNNGLTVEYIDFVTSNGNYRATSSGGSSSGGSSTTDFGEGITVSNKEITLNSIGLSRAVTDDMITNDSVVMTFTFNTPSGEFGYGNGKYKAVIDNEYKETNNFSFQETAVIRSLKVSDICNLFGIATSDFRKISEFRIECWNQTTISDVSFINITASTDPDTPTGGESENTSNNTEEGAIDKDTTAPDGYIGLIAKNSPMGDKTSITVKKEWVDDTGYETTLRPESITVQLYRSTDPNLSTDNLTDDMKSGDSVTIQDTNGKWEHTWTNLDTKDESNNNYYYYVKEVTDLNNYTVSYENNGISSGDITIKNTLKTVDISVNKVWSVPENVTGVTNPSSVTVKLQTSSDGTSWTDVSGKTLNLNENNWTGKFEKLPAGKYYKVVETNIPTGWTASYSDNNGNQFSSNGKNITVTNTISLASLNIKKNWEDNVGDVRPENIKINLYRSTTPPAGSTTSNSVQPISLKEPANNYEDYSRLLQYSLYFYDANMCGNDVTNSSDLTWRNNCHIDDAVLGGYHDAGDHVMFGLPQGYTASTLGWSYYENKDIYDGLGQTEHYQKIMKRFCDFFVASSNEIENGHIKRLLYQKGDAGTDHDYWGSPEKQSSRANEMAYVNYGEPKGSDIAAEYAAALALYYLNFPDRPESADYLERAKLLYDFSIHNGGATPVSGYGSQTYVDDQAWAAGWLYLATQKQGNAVNDYKDFCLSNSETINDWTYCWDDVSLGAACLNAYINNDWSKVNSFLTNLGVTSTSAGYWVKSDWGSARYNTAIQMIALIASKRSDADYSEWCKSQMSFLLGDNPISKCFVTGFADNSVQYPHHRAASGYESSDDVKNNQQTVYATDGHVLIGALVGGPSSANCSAYGDSMQDYNQNEVALDYNATLVGAAAALFAKYGTGTLKTVASDIGAGVKSDRVYLQPNPVLTVYGKSTMYKGNTQTLTAENATGTVTWLSSDSDILTVDENGLVTAVSNGKATITATDSSDNSASFDITVTSSAIAPDIPEGLSPFMSITLTKNDLKSDGSWTQLVENLPITDGQGNTYYYYIAEVDDRGDIISNKVSGYIPVEYDNGKSLSETGTELSVTNKKSDVDEGSMPSTGGTGTQPYKVIGMVMAGGALIMLGIRRRKKHC